MSDVADVQVNQVDEQQELDALQAEIEQVQEAELDLAALLEVAKVQTLAEQIEASGTPEMKAKLKPFKEHYEGNIAVLIAKRTKQNFDNDVWSEVSKKSEEEKAKYRKSPDSYLSAEEQDAFMQRAYDKTIEEAKKLAASLQQTVAATPLNAGSAAPTPKRRLMFGGAN